VDRLAALITRYGPPAAVLVLLATAWPLWLASRARIDNSIEVWLGRRSSEYQRYQQFRQRYGSDELIIVAAEMPQPLSEPASSAQRQLADSLRRIDGVSQVVCLPEVTAPLALLTPELRDRPQDQPLIRNFLLSADGRTAGVVAWLKPLHGAQARRAVVHAVRDAAAIWARSGFQPHIAGAPVLNVALDEASSREARLLLPLAAGFASIMLVVFLRSLFAAAACLIAAGATVIWTVAAMVLCGLTLNMISVALPALLVVLALSPGLHIATRFLAHPGVATNRPLAMRAVAGELLAPIAISTVTTALGFGSLIVADMKPVSEVGLFAAVGMLLSLLLNLIIVPGLLLLLPAVPRHHARPARARCLMLLGAAVSRWRWVVIGAAAALLAIAAFPAARLRAESNILSFFPPRSPVVADYQFISQRLTGLYTLELDTATPLEHESATLAAIERISRQLSLRSDVARVDHYGLFRPLLAGMRLLRELPLAQSSQAIEEAAARFRRVEHDTVHLRASLLVRSMSSEDFYSLVQSLRAQAAAELPPMVRSNVTGAVLLLNDAQAALVRTQVRSFATAAATSLLTMGLLFGSWRVAAAAVLPNLLPILGAFGLMALLDIPLDAATVMIASVAIGLSDDSTIHFASCYRAARQQMGAVAAAGAALAHSGPAMISASVVTAAGFALLCFADFRPLAHFGLLTGFTLLAAAACNLLIAPASAGVLRLWQTDALDSHQPLTGVSP
jgi:predicted RND superfamily exporter protein